MSGAVPTLLKVWTGQASPFFIVLSTRTLKCLTVLFRTLLGPKWTAVRGEFEVFGDAQDDGEMYDGCGGGGRMVRLSGGVVVSAWFDRKCCFTFYEESVLKRSHLKD
jgi:hypothetical protein